MGLDHTNALFSIDPNREIGRCDDDDEVFLTEVPRHDFTYFAPNLAFDIPKRSQLAPKIVEFDKTDR